MGSGCEHVEHVRTQLPYAATAAFAATVGFLLVGVWPTSWMLLPVLGLLAATALMLGWVADRKSDGTGDVGQAR